jgi:NAD(P) transhydrogenase
MSEKYNFDFLIIGSGPAGQRAAVQASKLGKRVAIIEKRRAVGGVSLDVGTIPSKMFREAVLSLTGPGSVFEKGKLDLQPRGITARELLERVDEVVKRETSVVENQLHRNGISVIKGEASFKDPHTLIVADERSAREVSAENILIAVGTTPVPVPGVDIAEKNILTSDDIACMEKLPRTLAVVGGGVIGIEYASMFAALGIEVTLVDKRNRPMEFLDAEIVDELIHQMRNRNVIFRFNESVAKVLVSDQPSRCAVIELESGKRIVTDMLLFSVGRMGATEKLELKAAGLSADHRGRLKVDSEFRTDTPHIFAAGDIIGYPSLAATSMEQGRLAACYAFNIKTRPMADHFPIGIYAIPEISMAGQTEGELTEKKIPYETGIARYREIARGQILGDDTGLFKLLFHRENKKLLGVHIIGTGATELVHIGQAVLGLGAGLDYFMETVFNYPTLAECYKVAALDAYNKFQI